MYPTQHNKKKKEEGKKKLEPNIIKDKKIVYLNFYFNQETKNTAYDKGMILTF
jgi:hypothetical protein